MHFMVISELLTKEPRRDDYEAEPIKPERLFDYELGWKYNTKKCEIVSKCILHAI